MNCKLNPNGCDNTIRIGKAFRVTQMLRKISENLGTI